MGDEDLHVSATHSDNTDQAGMEAVLTGDGGLVGFIRHDPSGEQRFLISRSAWSPGEIGVGYERIVAAISGECGADN